MDISKKLKNRRKELSLTMLEVARKVGVSEATVSRWESGDIANMRRDKIALLASALHVTPAYIMGWEDADNECASNTKIQNPPILEKYNKLNDIGQIKTEAYIDGLLENPNYLKEEKSAHENGPSIKTKFAARNGKSFERELTKEEIEKSKQLPKFPNNL